MNSPRLTLLTEAYDRFISKAHLKTSDESWQIWLREIDAVLPDFYINLVIRDSHNEDKISAYKKALTEALLSDFTDLIT